MFPSPLALYIHWPFCRSICPYCHFNRYQERALDWPTWYQAFETEIRYWAQRTPHHFIKSIFFGGGTPSLMQPALTEHILTTIAQCWPMEADIEITLEMNPTDYATIESFQKAGINRISMGIQSFHDDTLALLGRTHRQQHLTQALSALRSSGIRYSFDLIYAHAHHEEGDQWSQELDTALTWVQDHISLYQLSYEQGTPFYQYRQQELSDERTLDLEECTHRALSPLGFKRYEISNYARPGHESQHNLMYWLYEDFVGLGPGSHGRLKHQNAKIATYNYPLPDRWLQQIEQHKNGLAKEEILSRQHTFQEKLLMTLRLKEGLELSQLRNANEDFTPEWHQRIAMCQKDDLLCVTSHRIILTRKGRGLLNSIVEYLSHENCVPKNKK